MKATRLFSFLAAVIVLNCLAVAQTASIVGVVSDSSGAVVSGAQITVLNTDTGAVRTVNSGDTGAYAVTNLPVGKYRIEIKKQKFAQFRVSPGFPCFFVPSLVQGVGNRPSKSVRI